MVEKTFLIAFDVRDERLDTDALKEFVKTNPDYTAWWNHIPGLYFVQTRLSPQDISEQIEAELGRLRFLTMEVNPANSQGRLKQRSWDWIRRRRQVTAEHDERFRPS